MTRKKIKCLYPKVEKSQPKKKKCKTVKTSEELTVKRVVCSIYYRLLSNKKLSNFHNL